MNEEKIDNKTNDPLNLGYRMSKNLGFLSLGFIAMSASVLNFDNPVEKAEFIEDILPLMSGILGASLIGMAGCKLTEGVKTLYNKIKSSEDSPSPSTKNRM